MAFVVPTPSHAASTQAAPVLRAARVAVQPRATGLTSRKVVLGRSFLAGEAANPGWSVAAVARRIGAVARAKSVLSAPAQRFLSTIQASGNAPAGLEIPSMTGAASKFLDVNTLSSLSAAAEKTVAQSLTLAADAPASQAALAAANLKSPAVLAFFLGAIAAFVRSDLSFPAGYQSSISIYLLLALGLKGGVAVANVADLSTLAGPAFGTLLLGCIAPAWTFFVLKNWLKLSLEDACAMAAHYASTSAVTFIASLTFMELNKVSVEGYMPALLTLLEIPGIIIALLTYAYLKGEPEDEDVSEKEYVPRPVESLSPGPLVSMDAKSEQVMIGDQATGAAAASEEKKTSSSERLKEAIADVLYGKSIILLIGGLIIGWVCGEEGFKKVSPFFVQPFQGILLMFLLELGLIAGNRFRDFLSVGPSLAVFAILAPIINGSLGVLIGHQFGLSVGGSTVLAALAASASYIAAPAAVRIAIPDANPSYYVTTSLAITFPFNITIGIPLYYALAQAVFNTGAA
eukprot:tig00021435_g21408.t1